MASRRGQSRRGPISEMNVVPYIDVMLVLLVIFMITAPLLSQGVNVDLPKAQAKQLTKEEKQPIIVTVDGQGHYFLNVMQQPNQPIMAHQLLNRVAAELAIAKEKGIQRHVLVKGDQHAGYGQVVQAMIILQKAGAGSVGLVTDPS